VKPPRTVFVNHPMGNTFGRPFDAEMQRRVLLDALHALESVTVAGAMIDLPYEWHEEFDIRLNSPRPRQDGPATPSS